ncbi:MAG TPA: AI-2E family transporter [Gemmatimonadales bacterium]|nr:AI-2E family transporter [Gemmatimonadales bacterium]
MAIFDTTRQRASLVIVLLGTGIALALASYVSGLIGAAVLYVIFAPLHDYLVKYLRPAIAAGLVTAVALLVIVFPGASLVTLLLNQAQDIARGVTNSTMIAKIQHLTIAGYAVGPRLATLGDRLISMLGSTAFGLIGTATRLVLNLTIAFFGLYYLLLHPAKTWEFFRPYIPFSQSNSEKLQKRFRDVTNSTLIGTLLVAVVQGALIGLTFFALGLSNSLFWGVVTAAASILPVVGSTVVWGPGAAVLALDNRLGAAVFVIFVGVVVISSVDNFIRPFVYRRWAQIHPLVTLIGAFGGVKYFGLLGILIGPLALSYFFELIRMYHEEYVEPAAATA